MMTDTNPDAPIVLKDCTVLGASGFPFSIGKQVIVGFFGTAATCTSGEQIARFSLVEVVDIAITGPGTTIKGGGFVGGGFGVEGALEGIAIAGVLNALTTKKTTHTFLTITTNFGELHLHYGLMEPGALRIHLSGVFVQLRRASAQWANTRIQLIDDYLAAGAIAPEDAQTYRARVTAPAIWPDPDAEKKALQRIEEKAFQEAAKGLCPNCDKIIPLLSETCKFCRANFGEYASWKVLPIT